MGATSVDIHKKERLYRNLTLSDANVVKYLILYRSKVDIMYGANININIYEAGDIFEFNQELIALYASLDQLIERLNLKCREKKFLKLIFDGYSVPEIIDDYNYPQKTAYRMLNRIVSEIIKLNYDDWKKSMQIQGYIPSEVDDERT